jgi:hypothetical protein
MYSTEHSIPNNVEWPEGSVLGPVSIKKFGKNGAVTLQAVSKAALGQEEAIPGMYDRCIYIPHVRRRIAAIFVPDIRYGNPISPLYLNW